MKIVKLLVLLCYVGNIEGNINKYCEICRNHTLCLYPTSGPSVKCKAYDEGALLTGSDINEILDRINARRNLVAVGRLYRFPQAANMKRIRWSKELSIFAQRWADQCDPSIKPNRNDICRDFPNMQVGQSISSVSGSTPGLTVKSFIDMWFMMKLRYIGNIVYYNQSRDERANHFTQLIWANTEYVGCGKVKFFNQELNTVIERLVCNFAPKGNHHGRPVYAIGYPATQCPNFMEPDAKYPGLCTGRYENVVRKPVTVKNASKSNLLSILDLSNNSMKQDLDPNNLNLTSQKINKINNQRKQQSRHLYFSNSYGAVKRDSFHIQNPPNEPDHYKIRIPERGHSKVYHGYQTQQISTMSLMAPETPSTPIDDYRRYDLMNARNTQVSQPRRYFGSVARDQHCTRKSKMVCFDNCFTTSCVINQCTRGTPQHQLNQSPHSCTTCVPPSLSPSHQDTCPCNIQSKCSTVSPQCNYNTKYQCVNNNKCPSHEETTCCAKRRVGDEDKPNHFNYEDLFPSVEMRSGDRKISQKQLNPETELNDNSDRKESNIDIVNRRTNQVKAVAGNLGTSLPQESYYDLFYSSERKRRDFEDQQTFKPFWQMDEYNDKKQPQLKSLRYTTLGNKRNKKTKRPEHARLPTESITIQQNNNYHNNPHNNKSTERYLSFEELMRLRKLSTQDVFGNDARRVGDGLLYTSYLRGATKKTTKQTTTTTIPTTTTKPTTAATTTNTPFNRVKYCTRKLTCTWTAMTVTLQDGRSVMAGGGGVDIASRTPKGYVEGCTRTSTCTRDFLDRNKFESTTQDPDHDNTEKNSTDDDEGDYCEKRALDIRKRNVNTTEKKEFWNTELEKENRSHVDFKRDLHNQCHCICNNESRRVKRQDNSYYDRLLNHDCKSIKRNKITGSNNDEPYLSMLQRISISSKLKNSRHHCPCNNGKSNNLNVYWIVLLKCYFTWIYVFYSHLKG